MEAVLLLARRDPRHRMREMRPICFLFLHVFTIFLIVGGCVLMAFTDWERSGLVTVNTDVSTPESAVEGTAFAIPMILLGIVGWVPCSFSIQASLFMSWHVTN